MNKILLFNVVILTLGFLGGSSAFAIQLPWQNNPSKAIPPTPAIMNVTTSNSTISSDTWNEVLNFIGLRGIDIFGSNNSKTVYFNVTIVDENGTNLGTGAKVFKNETNHLWYFRTLHNGTNIAITSNSTGITISGTGSGESTTGSNIGSTGEGVFSALVGFDLQFKKLLAGAGISLSSNSTNITITNTATSSGYTKINNLDGGDAKVLATNSSLQATVKTLTAGSGVTITNGSKTITIAVTPGTDTNTAQIVSAGGTSIFKQRDNATQNTLYGLDTSRGISLFTDTNTININTNFKVNSATCSAGQHLFSFTNSTTGIGFTCTADTVGTAYTKINSLSGGTASLVATNTTLSNTQATFKTLTQGTGISITNGSNTLTISSTITGGFTELNSINGGNARLLKSNSTNEGVFKSLTAARGISITNGTDTITIDAPLKVANQTQTKDQFIQAINNSTGLITRLQFSVNTQSCSAGQHVFSIDNSTGYVTCTGDTGGTAYTKINNLDGGDAKIVATNTTLSNTQATFKTFTNGAGITITNGSKTITIASTITQGYTKANNLDGGDAKIFATNSSNQVTAKTLTAGSGISITNGSKTITITSTASGGGFTQVSHLAGGDASILYSNSSNKAIFKKLSQTANNVTISGNSTGILTWNLGSNVVVTGGSAQTFASGKKITTSPSSTTSGFNIVTRSSDITQPRQGDIWISGGALKYNDNNNVTQNIEGGVIKNKRWGTWIPNSASALGAGILGTTAALDGTETFEYNTTRGVLSIRSATGAVAGNNAGISQVTANFNLFRGDQNPYLRIEAAPTANHAAAGTRIFIGFQSGSGLLPAGADTIVNALSAAGICKRTTDSTYQLCTNDAAGAGTYTNTGVSVNTNWHTFEVFTTDGGVSWCALIDGGSKTCDSTDEPATTTRLYFNAQSETTGVSLNFNYGYVYVQNDK